jgi:hypothetical protein
VLLARYWFPWFPCGHRFPSSVGVQLDTLGVGVGVGVVGWLVVGGLDAVRVGESVRVGVSVVDGVRVGVAEGVDDGVGVTVGEGGGVAVCVGRGAPSTPEKIS